MSDYMVSRTFAPNQQAISRPAGPAIRALQAANVRLEQAQPRQQSVPAYQPTSRGASPDQIAGRNG